MAISYPATSGDRVTIDPDDVRGPWTIQLPFPIDNGDNVTVKAIGTYATAVTVQALGAATTVEDPTDEGSVGNPVSFFMRNQKSVTFVYNAGRDEWNIYGSSTLKSMYWSGAWAAGSYQANEVVEHKGNLFSCAVATTTLEPGTLAGSADWDLLGNTTREVWQATPIVGMTSQTVQWTFLPLFTGQTPTLLSEAAGTFTFLTNGAVVDFQLQPFLTYQIAANNSDCQYTIIPTYTGAGIDTLLGIRGSMGSPRAAAFPTSGFSLGMILAAVNDTLIFTADSSGTNGSNVDLDQMILQIRGPSP